MSHDVLGVVQAMCFASVDHSGCSTHGDAGLGLLTNFICFVLMLLQRSVCVCLWLITKVLSHCCFRGVCL